MSGYKNDLGKNITRLVKLFKWLDKIGIEDGDIDSLKEFVIFSKNPPDRSHFNVYLELRHWFLDDYASNGLCFLDGQEIYDLTYNMYKSGYRLMLDKLEND